MGERRKEKGKEKKLDRVSCGVSGRRRSISGGSVGRGFRGGVEPRQKEACYDVCISIGNGVAQPGHILLKISTPRSIPGCMTEITAYPPRSLD